MQKSKQSAIASILAISAMCLCFAAAGAYADLDVTVAVPTHKDELFRIKGGDLRLVNDPNAARSLTSVAWLPPVSGDPRNLLVATDPKDGSILLYVQEPTGLWLQSVVYHRSFGPGPRAPVAIDASAAGISVGSCDKGGCEIWFLPRCPAIAADCFEAPTLVDDHLAIGGEDVYRIEATQLMSVPCTDIGCPAPESLTEPTEGDLVVVVSSKKKGSGVLFYDREVLGLHNQGVELVVIDGFTSAKKSKKSGKSDKGGPAPFPSGKNGGAVDVAQFGPHTLLIALRSGEIRFFDTAAGAWGAWFVDRAQAKQWGFYNKLAGMDLISDGTEAAVFVAIRNGRIVELVVSGFEAVPGEITRLRPLTLDVAATTAGVAEVGACQGGGGCFPTKNVGHLYEEIETGEGDLGKLLQEVSTHIDPRFDEEACEFAPLTIDGVTIAPWWCNKSGFFIFTKTSVGPDFVFRGPVQTIFVDPGSTNVWEPGKGKPYVDRLTQEFFFFDKITGTDEPEVRGPYAILSSVGYTNPARSLQRRGSVATGPFSLTHDLVWQLTELQARETLDLLNGTQFPARTGPVSLCGDSPASTPCGAIAEPMQAALDAARQLELGGVPGVGTLTGTDVAEGQTEVTLGLYTVGGSTLTARVTATGGAFKHKNGFLGNVDNGPGEIGPGQRIDIALELDRAFGGFEPPVEALANLPVHARMTEIGIGNAHDGSEFTDHLEWAHVTLSTIAGPQTFELRIRPKVIEGSPSPTESTFEWFRCDDATCATGAPDPSATVVQVSPSSAAGLGHYRVSYPLAAAPLVTDLSIETVSGGCAFAFCGSQPQVSLERVKFVPPAQTDLYAAIVGHWSRAQCLVSNHPSRTLWDGDAGSYTACTTAPVAPATLNRTGVNLDFPTALLVQLQTSSFFAISAGLCGLDDADNGALDHPLCTTLTPYSPVAAP